MLILTLDHSHFEYNSSHVRGRMSTVCPCDSFGRSCYALRSVLWALYFSGGMPPTPQATQLTGQKQSQQQYDPSTGPPVQNAASLHTPPPQLPARLPPASVPATALPSTLQFSQQSQMVEAPAQLQIPVKTQQLNAPIPAPLPSQLPAPSSQPAQPALHVPMSGKAQMQTSQLSSQTQVLCGHWLFY